MRAKNVVFIFKGDTEPTAEEIRAVANDPSREIEKHWVNSWQDVEAIYQRSPVAYQHFATKSVDSRTLKAFAGAWLVVLGEPPGENGRH